MAMRKQNGTATRDELAILASSCGLVENSEQGRQAFCAWWANDQKAARKALFTRVAARRAGIRSITAAERQAVATGQPTEHGMRVQHRSTGASVVRSAHGQTPVASGEGND